MTRHEVEVQAPWALSYYDAGVENGKKGPQQTMLGLDNWLDIQDHVPDIDQDVLYYFEGVGIGLGTYKGVDNTPEWGLLGHVFAGDSGWLTDDVTHWLPLPNPPDIKTSV